MANCAVCREDIAPAARCPRCGYDNNQLGEMNDLVAYWGSLWGILSFLLIFPPLFMLFPGAFWWMNAVLQPIASVMVGGPIALLCTLVIAFYVYSLRRMLHHYTLTLRFREKPARPVPIWALIFFVAAIFLAFFLSFGLANKAAIVAPEGYGQSEMEGLLAYGGTGHMFLKLLMTGCFIFIFVFLSLSAGLMAAYLYSEYVAENRPDPIFLNEQLLLRVVLKFVREQLGPNADVNVSEMKRLEDGGISLDLHHKGELTTRGDITVREDKTWEAESDCWGRVKQVEEKATRLIKVS